MRREPEVQGTEWWAKSWPAENGPEGVLWVTGAEAEAAPGDPSAGLRTYLPAAAASHRQPSPETCP